MFWTYCYHKNSKLRCWRCLHFAIVINRCLKANILVNNWPPCPQKWIQLNILSVRENNCVAAVAAAGPQEILGISFMMCHLQYWLQETMTHDFVNHGKLSNTIRRQLFIIAVSRSFHYSHYILPAPTASALSIRLLIE